MASLIMQILALCLQLLEILIVPVAITSITLCMLFFFQMALKVALCRTFVGGGEGYGEKKMSSEKNCKITP